MLKAILPGHFWTTLNGILVTVWGLESASLTIKMDWKDIPKAQPSGSRVSCTSSHYLKVTVIVAIGKKKLNL